MADFVTSLNRAPGETAPGWLDRLQKIDPIPLAPEEREFLQGYTTLAKAAVTVETTAKQIRKSKEGTD